MFGIVAQIRTTSPSGDSPPSLSRQRLKDFPFLWRQGNHHPSIVPVDFVGQEVVRDILLELRFAVGSTQRTFERCKQVVAANRHAEREQRSFRIPQRVQLTSQVQGQFIERGLQGPSLLVQLCYLHRRDARCWQIRQQMNLHIAVARGRVQLHGDPAHSLGLAGCRVAQLDGLLVNPSRRHATNVASFPHRFPRHPAVLSGDEQARRTIRRRGKPVWRSCGRGSAGRVVGWWARSLQKRQFLRMGVFAGEDVHDDHTLRVQQHQRLARQGTGRCDSQHSQAMLGFAQVIPVKDS